MCIRYIYIYVYIQYYRRLLLLHRAVASLLLLFLFSFHSRGLIFIHTNIDALVVLQGPTVFCFSFFGLFSPSWCTYVDAWIFAHIISITSTIVCKCIRAYYIVLSSLQRSSHPTIQKTFTPQQVSSKAELQRILLAQAEYKTKGKRTNERTSVS